MTHKVYVVVIDYVEEQDCIAGVYSDRRRAQSVTKQAQKKNPEATVNFYEHEIDDTETTWFKSLLGIGE